MAALYLEVAAVWSIRSPYSWISNKIFHGFQNRGVVEPDSRKGKSRVCPIAFSGTKGDYSERGAKWTTGTGSGSNLRMLWVKARKGWGRRRGQRQRKGSRIDFFLSFTEPCDKRKTSKEKRKPISLPDSTDLPYSTERRAPPSSTSRGRASFFARISPILFKVIALEKKMIHSPPSSYAVHL